MPSERWQRVGLGVLLVSLGCSEAPATQPAAAGQAAGGASGGGAATLAGSGGSDVSGGAPTGGGGATGGSGGSTQAGGGSTSTAGGGGMAPAELDPGTMLGKHLFGYQGWFAAPGDGSPRDRWVHWFSGNTPTAEAATFDLWPDLSELDDDELFPTSLTLPGGAPARLFSSYKEKTVVRHFAWMKDAGIDGVFVQRFLLDVRSMTTKQVRDQVLLNARAGAEQHGRVFSVMYDVSGAPENSLTGDLLAEWAYLVETLKITESPRYLRHAGKPVLAVWGLGFSDRPGTAAQARDIIDQLQTGPHPVTLVGGVPSNWRTLDEDSKTEAAWADVYRSFDVLSPWAVGRYADDAGADTFREQRIAPDLAELAGTDIAYMPVVFPGFSWHNLNDEYPLNQIPRRGGAFYWRQVHNALQAGSTMLYGAMFDEVDEGTAFFKAAPSSDDLPEQGTFLALDADGESLPSDWYLRLGGAATRALRGEIAATPQLPIPKP